MLEQAQHALAASRAKEGQLQAELDAEKAAAAERAKALHDKVRAGAQNHKLKKKAHSERYRAEARKANFGTRPGQVETDEIDETY